MRQSTRSLGRPSGARIHFRGSCAETDAASDTVFTTFDNDNHYIVGGTGKYTGITGTVPYTAMQLADTVGGRTARVVNHKASWFRALPSEGTFPSSVRPDG